MNVYTSHFYLFAPFFYTFILGPYLLLINIYNHIYNSEFINNSYSLAQ